jgi:hypothetical protein
MQIITRIDLVFVSIYSGLILLIGIAAALASQKPEALLLTLLALLIYLSFALKKPFKRFRSLKKSFPNYWSEILNRHSIFYRNLDLEARQRFENDIRMFLSTYSIKGIRGAEADEKTRLLVACGIVTLLNGRPEWEPPVQDGVLIYPGSAFNRDYEIGRGMRAGQATPRSPMIVTRSSLDESFQYPGQGGNVVYHELAHYFDMEDGVAKGVPITRLDRDKLENWKKLISAEWEKASNGYSFLGTYAGTNEAETFAVAVEVFFETPKLMLNNNPAMYEALKDFFNIDTLEIMERNF